MAKNSITELTQKDKKFLIASITDHDILFDDYIDSNPQWLEGDEDGEKEEIYYVLIKDFAKLCRDKLMEMVK